MTKNKFLCFVVTALMLSVLMTLTALAAVEGGMGIIKGVDETYKAASAVINGAGDGLAVDTADAFVLSDENNTGLAGIYAVSNDDFATQTLVYVYGDFAERKLVPNKMADDSGRALYTSSKDFVAGSMTGPNSTSMTANFTHFQGGDGAWWGSGASKYNVGSVGAHISGNLVKAVDTAADAAAKAEALDNIAKQYKTGLYWRYGYDGSEIVPVSEFELIRYKVYNRQGRKYRLPADTLGEFRLYVADKTGAVKYYSVKKSANVANLDSWGKSVEIFAADFTSLPEEGWIIGFEIIPFADFDAAKATIDATKDGSSYSNICYGLCIDYERGMYSISAPKAEKPTGLAVDKNGKVTGLQSGVSYEYVNLNNTTRLKEFAETGAANTDLVYLALDSNTTLSAGVYAVRVSQTPESPASDPAVLYVQGKEIADILHIDFDTGYVIDDGAIYQSGGWRAAVREMNIRYFNKGVWSGALYPQSTYLTKSGLTLFNSGDNNIASWSAESFVEGTYTRQQAVDALEAEYATYQYLDSEVIPFSMLESYTYKTETFKTQYLFDGNVNTKLIFYVINEKGELESRVWTNPIDAAGTTTHIVKAEHFEDTAGYIIAIEIHPTGDIPDTTKLAAKATATSDRTSYCITLMEGGYKIAIPKAIEGKPQLTVTETVVSGFDPELTYEYANLNSSDALAGYAASGEMITEPEYITLEKGTESVDLGAGLWGIRVAGEEGVTKASDMAVIYIRGAATTILHTTEEGAPITEKYPATGAALRSYTPLFMKGTWRGTLPAARTALTGTALSFGFDAYGTAVCWAGESYNKGDIDHAGLVKAVESDHMTYQYTDDEIIPIDDFISYTYKSDVRQGSVNMREGGTIKTTFTLYTVQDDGSIKSYTVSERMDFTGRNVTTHTFTREAFGADATGYIVAFEIRPTGEVTDGTELYVDPEYLVADAYDIHLVPDGYTAKYLAPAPEVISFPVIAGGYGNISGLNAEYLHEIRWSTDGGETFTEWADVPAGSTAFKVTVPGIYQLRVKDSDFYAASKITTVNVLSADYVDTFNSQLSRVYLTEDFVEIKADYEIDVTAKNWISTLSLQNLKEVTPESTVIIAGDEFKYQFTAGNINADDKIHYYNFDISFDGESRSDINHKKFVEASGELYVKNVYFESSNGLPFTKAELSIYVGNDYDGMELDSASYNDRIDRLRYLEIVQVTDGWVTLTQFGEPMVLLVYED